MIHHESIFRKNHRLLPRDSRVLRPFAENAGAAGDPAETDGYAIVETGVQFYFAANATTGYSWAQTQQGDSVALEKEYYAAPKTEPPMAGQGGTQFYVYRAVKPGTTTITFTYQRPWETNPPITTYVAVVVVADDLSVSVSSFEKR